MDGIPESRIVEVAQRECDGLIIMGSHRRSGFARLLMRSGAEAVTRQSPVRVTVVNNGARLFPQVGRVRNFARTGLEKVT